jgi:hypothetical protein
MQIILVEEPCYELTWQMKPPLSAGLVENTRFLDACKVYSMFVGLQKPKRKTTIEKEDSTRSVLEILRLNNENR